MPIRHTGATNVIGTISVRSSHTEKVDLEVMLLTHVIYLLNKRIVFFRAGCVCSSKNLSNHISEGTLKVCTRLKRNLQITGVFPFLCLVLS